MLFHINCNNIFRRKFYYLVVRNTIWLNFTSVIF